MRAIRIQCDVSHGVQDKSIEAILACHPALSQNDWTGGHNRV